MAPGSVEATLQRAFTDAELHEALLGGLAEGRSRAVATLGPHAPAFHLGQAAYLLSCRALEKRLAALGFATALVANQTRYRSPRRWAPLPLTLVPLSAEPDDAGGIALGTRGAATRAILAANPDPQGDLFAGFATSEGVTLLLASRVRVARGEAAVRAWLLLCAAPDGKSGRAPVLRRHDLGERALGKADRAIQPALL
jgi:hypothetical protein